MFVGLMLREVWEAVVCCVNVKDQLQPRDNNSQQQMIVWFVRCGRDCLSIAVCQ